MTAKTKKQGSTSGAKGGKKLKLKKNTLKDLDTKGGGVKGGLMARTANC